MSDRPPLSGFAGAIHRAALLLRRRLEELELRIRAADEQAWPEYREVALAVASMERELREALPANLTTREMAEKIGVSPRTLLRRVRRGRIRPAIHEGKLVRWKGTEAEGRR